MFEKNQLNPEAAPQILGDLVRRYTTIIGYGADGILNPVGSGTFLRRTDGEHGILTAGHVIGAIKTKNSIFVLPAQDRKMVLWVGTEGTGMEDYRLSKVPDLGWVPLSGEEVEEMKARGAVFYNMAKERDHFEDEVCTIGIIGGFVATASSLEQKEVIAHGLIMCETKAIPPDQDGWDYDEYAITNDDPWIPQTHGGLSGSAVWRVDLPMDGSGRKAIILPLLYMWSLGIAKTTLFRYVSPTG